jgi:hypothetical protein
MKMCENHLIAGEHICDGRAVAQVAMYDRAGRSVTIMLCNQCSSRVYEQSLIAYRFMHELFNGVKV